jgi:hypothetical protein
MLLILLGINFIFNITEHSLLLLTQLFIICHFLPSGKDIHLKALSDNFVLNIKERRKLSTETDRKLIFVLEFDTELFEFRLLRPAFVLLLALLPTSTVFFLLKNMIAVPCRTVNVFLGVLLLIM